MNQNKISEGFLFAGIVLLIIGILAVLVLLWDVLKSIAGAIMSVLSWIGSGFFSLSFAMQIFIIAIIGCLICYVGFNLFNNSNNRTARRRRY